MQMDGKARTFHIGLHIEGTLRQHGNKLKGLLSVDGQELSGAQVKAFLRKHKADNPFHEIFCGCGHVNEDGGCAGHVQEGSGDE